MWGGSHRFRFVYLFGLNGGVEGQVVGGPCTLIPRGQVPIVLCHVGVAHGAVILVYVPGVQYPVNNG